MWEQVNNFTSGGVNAESREFVGRLGQAPWSLAYPWRLSQPPYNAISRLVPDQLGDDGVIFLREALFIPSFQDVLHCCGNRKPETVLFA